VPTFVGGDTSHTYIDFRGCKEEQSIDAVPYPVACRRIHGTAGWTGVYGLSGAFDGWFSDDDAHVPIIAKMSVYVGSVTLELVRWKRPGWNPPNADQPMTANTIR